MNDLPMGCIAKGAGTLRSRPLRISLTREELSADCTTISGMSVWRYPKSRPSWLGSLSVNTVRDAGGDTESDQESPASTSDGDVPNAPSHPYCLSENPSEIEMIWCGEEVENNPESKPTHVYVLQVVHQPKEDKQSPVPLILQKGFNKVNAQESLQALWNWATATFNVAPSTGCRSFGLRTLQGLQLQLKVLLDSEGNSVGSSTKADQDAADRDALKAACEAFRVIFPTDNVTYAPPPV
jgi:hypothetical protein